MWSQRCSVSCPRPGRVSCEPAGNLQRQEQGGLFVVFFRLRDWQHNSPQLPGEKCGSTALVSLHTFFVSLVRSKRMFGPGGFRTVSDCWARCVLVVLCSVAPEQPAQECSGELNWQRIPQLQGTTLLWQFSFCQACLSPSFVPFPTREKPFGPDVALFVHSNSQVYRLPVARCEYLNDSRLRT